VHDERVTKGIPLPTGTWQKLEAASKRFGIPLPTVI
jgi:LDH2 family malate/lactate/ureidoglycolate dehydrogenase